MTPPTSFSREWSNNFQDKIKVLGFLILETLIECISHILQLKTKVN